VSPADLKAAAEDISAAAGKFSGTFDEKGVTATGVTA
jgi:hypothetical protein